jgi:probable phosphoglycerate mutase
MTNFTLIRHGETAWNRELRFQGQLDVPLNEMGILQAQRLKFRLLNELNGWRANNQVPTRLISSDLLRAQQTAEPLSEVLEQGCIVDNRWREQCFGIFEGLQAKDIQVREPEAWKRWLAFDPDYAVHGAESTRAFYDRVVAALHDLAQQYQGEHVVVVTHGGVLDMIWRHVRSEPLQGPRVCDIPNAGLNHVAWKDDALHIKLWADAAHLSDLPAQPVYRQTKN